MKIIESLTLSPGFIDDLRLVLFFLNKHTTMLQEKSFNVYSRQSLYLDHRHIIFEVKQSQFLVTFEIFTLEK